MRAGDNSKSKLPPKRRKLSRSVSATEYDDSFPTCVETFSTLRVFSDEMGPDEISELLQIHPTRAFRKGDTHNKGKLKRKSSGWFYCTRSLSSSRDSRRHIDLILKALGRKAYAVRKLHQRGCKIDIITYWLSVGQGGPWMMPQQMLKLGTLGIDVWWDIYFDDAGENK